PRLRLSERDKGPGSIGGLRGPGAVRPVARREPQLKLGRSGQRAPAGLGAAFAPAGLGAGTARVRFASRRREGVLGGSLLGGSRSGGGGLAGHAPRFSQGRSLTRLTTALRRSAWPKSPGRGWLRGASSRGASSRGASSRGASSRGGSLGRGSLGSASMSRRAFGARRI